MKNALVVAAVLLLAGCGTENKEQGARVPGPSDLQIAFTWSGGFIGRSDRIDIRPDGAARVTKRDSARRFQLDANQLRQLRTLVGDADLANVKAVKAPVGVADGFEYSLVYEGRTLSWGDGGEDPSPEVLNLAAFLADLIENH